MTIIVSAFPGVGKSYFTKNYNYVSKDLDSSEYRHLDFPKAYIAEIKELYESGDYDIILVSSHEVVREALIQGGLEYILVHPDITLKGEYLQRYRDRGSPDVFIQRLNTFWDEWVSSCMEDKNSIHTHCLDQGQYLGDVITDMTRMGKKSKVSIKDELKNVTLKEE